MKEKTLIIASGMALLLALFLILRIIAIKSDFEAAVRESHKTTEGYDQKFIDMVQRLEVILANRASFGYPGGKDPMTGVIRQVVQASAPAPMLHPANTKAGVSTPVQADPVRLTAIIGDGSGKKITAVVMDDERSYTVDIGDVVADRKVTRITNEGIWMENASQSFFYDIYGKKETTAKEGASQHRSTGQK